MGTLASGSIDLKSLKVAGGEASKFITAIDSDNGIKVHAANNINLNYTQITSEGMEVFKTNGASSNPSAISIAKFGEVVRIGKESAAHINITSGGLDLYNGVTQASNLIAHLGYDSSVDSGNTPYFTFGTRYTNSTIGLYSVAEGYETSAESGYSHTEGYQTIAQASNSSAKLWGAYSHVEGYMSSTNNGLAHAEGFQTQANGLASHAEGYGTVANGDYSHTEGYDTIANGDYSHASGLETITNGEGQFVCGKYNITDSNAMFILGNGTGANNRSNLMVVGDNLITIGKENSDSSVLYIEPGRITSVLGDKKLFEFGINTNTPYIEKKHEIRVVGNTDFIYNIPKGYLVEGMKFGVSIIQGTSGGYLPPDYDITYGTDGTATIYVQNGSTNARVTITYNFTNNTIAFGSWYGCSNQYKYRLVIWFKIPNIKPVFILGNNFAGLHSSVAEGENTSAYGYAAHSEGYQTQANADYSHAQNENTIANRRAQTTVGTYNIEDNHSDTTHPSGIDTYGNYSVIIGNGTNSNNRSNALTVDWNGSIGSYIDYDTDTPGNDPANGLYFTQFAIVNSNGNKVTYIDTHKWDSGETVGVFGTQRTFDNNGTQEVIQNQLGLGINDDESLFVWIPDGVKEAWRDAIGFSKTYRQLWSGAWYMNASQDLNLSQKVSEQPLGIVLAWSAYANGTAYDYDWAYSFIPKAHVLRYNGTGVTQNMSTVSYSRVGSKYVYVFDTHIKGHANNDKTGTANGITFANNYWVLRYVYGI